MRLLKWGLIGALTVLLVRAAVAAGPAVRWLSSWDEARALAAREKKPIVCYVYEEGHARTKKADTVLAGAQAEEFLAGCVCARLAKSTNPDFAKKYTAELYPQIGFFTPAAVPVKFLEGDLSKGRFLEQSGKFLERLKNPEPQRSQVKPGTPIRIAVAKTAHVEGSPCRCARCRPAIRKGFEYLLSNQRPDGGWGRPRQEHLIAEGEKKTRDRGLNHLDPVLTGLAGLALLAGGSTPDEGPHKVPIRKAAEFLARSVRDDGVISNHRDNDWFHLTLSNFQTPIAAMFLAEIQRLKPQPELAAKLGKVARYLEKGQDARGGAWGYGYDWQEYPRDNQQGWTLLATTHCAASAANALRDAGVEVSPDLFRKAASYLHACRGPDGAFTYRSEFRGGGYPGATSGALYALARSGGSGPGLDASEAYLRRTFPRIADFREHWWFFLFYTALAMNDLGPGGWEAFDDTFRETLIAGQAADGSWPDPDGRGGTLYATAIALFVLELPAGNLPIANRLRETGWPAPGVDPVEDPSYLEMPDAASHVKVFESKGRYWVDLVVSVETDADAAYFERLKRGILGANRLLYDVTDGQMSVHHVELAGGSAKWDKADLRIMRDFHAGRHLPHPWVHGATIVSTTRKVIKGEEGEAKSIGQYVELPLQEMGSEAPVDWSAPGSSRVIAHELCHYLFGIPDEYDIRTGEPFCECLVGGRKATELCGPRDHTDDRHRSCWELAKLLYPKLKIPERPDPGPWSPPEPHIEVCRAGK